MFVRKQLVLVSLHEHSDHYFWMFKPVGVDGGNAPDDPAVTHSVWLG
jgi:hypothetical protein